MSLITEPANEQLTRIAFKEAGRVVMAKDLVDRKIYCWISTFTDFRSLSCQFIGHSTIPRLSSRDSILVEISGIVGSHAALGAINEEKIRKEVLNGTVTEGAKKRALMLSAGETKIDLEGHISRCSFKISQIHEFANQLIHAYF